MKFTYGKNDWKTRERGEEYCYLLTNGLGGFSSLTMLGSAVRNDHALLMGCTKAPNNRYHILSRMEECVIDGRGRKSIISSQGYVNYLNNQNGHDFLRSFTEEYYPVWIYQISGVEIKKELIMKQGSNTLALRYYINNRTKEQVNLIVTPQMQFTKKGQQLKEEQSFLYTDSYVESNGIKLFYSANGVTEGYDTRYEADLFYPHDARDGREAVGCTANNHCICFTAEACEEKECVILYSLEKEEIGGDTAAAVERIFDEELERQRELVRKSGLSNQIAVCLVRSADQFIVDRESTEGKTIIAGYPFFEDWGRDTMIAIAGCCISTGRYEDAKNIFRTFMKYCRNGIMPNIFPEGGNEPAYNTVDASLLFIGAIYEYFCETEDIAFVKEAYPVMESIVDWYRRGTDFHIKMDMDGLIMAGEGYEQVTWMDVRIGDILPTPRHGKPVEVNAYWYNSLKIMEYFCMQLHGKEEADGYLRLAEKVSQSFADMFWNADLGCLRDVISDGADNRADDQIRCNQIWAVSVPFSILGYEREAQVVEKVFSDLYTSCGLRSLSQEDEQFHSVYGGTQLERDMAYHQGTVWTFPLGAYYLAYLKVNQYSEKAMEKVQEQLSGLEPYLREGCIGQLAEIYDGGSPSVSRGCFAQAWSVGEILKVYKLLQKRTDRSKVE